MTTEQQLQHRLDMVNDDMISLIAVLKRKGLWDLLHKFDDHWSSKADFPSTHIFNILIACDLKDDESLDWTRAN